MTTTVTIELTDNQVAMLRLWASSPNMTTADRAAVQRLLASTMAAALPPEPVRLTIELPRHVVAELADQHPSWDPESEVGPTIAATLNAVVAASRAHEAAR